MNERATTEAVYKVPAAGPILISSTEVFGGIDRARTTARPTSVGDTIFSRGASGQNCCQISVSTAPGISANTLIPCPRSSSRTVFVSASANPRLLAFLLMAVCACELVTLAIPPLARRDAVNSDGSAPAGRYDDDTLQALELVRR